jgi:hypothetical protein
MASIAIPLIALGSLYVMSNQEKNKKEDIKESYTNMTGIKNRLPGVNPPIPIKNFPITEPVKKSNNIGYYPNPNQVTDKYYDESMYEKIPNQHSDFGVGGSVQVNYSLSGKQINKDDFKHNNMVPFFGAKIKGATANPDVTESMLDNMQGQGSQIIKKQEQAPLFQPQQNLQYANGAPNMSDFLQSRVNPSMRMANVKPWEEEKVGPALGKGFTTQGSNGFNSGLEARDSWLPKTVNELRVDTNPKMTFGLNGHQGPATAYVHNSTTTEMQGKVEKYSPDTYYTVGQERWFTTTGLEKAQTARSVEVLQDVNRTSTTEEYFGISKRNEGDASYVKGASQEARRPVLAPSDIANPSALGHSSPIVEDYGSKSYTSLNNNRSTIRSENNFGMINGLMKAVVSPIMDVIRPSRKENSIGSIRPLGNVGALVSNNQIYNPADRTKTTIKEMTEGKLDNNHLNIEKQSSNAYLVSAQQPVNEQRDTTNVKYIGNAGPNGYVASRSYNAEYMQHNNVNKSYPNHPNQGGTQIFNQNDNINIHRRDSDRNNNRWWVPDASGQMTSTPSMDTYGLIKTPQTYDQNSIGCGRINPDILTAFKNNPYTQSLQSWV